MTLNASDLFLILVMIAGGFAMTYLMVLRLLRRLVQDNQLKIAERLGALDGAIQALETRLAEHHLAETRELQGIAGTSADDQDSAAEAVDPEVKAAIAAAAIAALGQSAVVKAVKPVSSPWSQQGRVLVQGSHNLRTRQ